MGATRNRIDKTLRNKLTEIRRSIALRLLLPAIAIMMVPPLSCFIFSQCATHYAHDNAEKQLAALQERVAPALENCFPKNGEADKSLESADAGTATGANGEAKLKPQDDADQKSAVSAFLGSACTVASQMGGDARLMVLSGTDKVVYPRDEQLRNAVATLASDFAQYAHEHGASNGEPISMVGSDGETYLAIIYEPTAQSDRLRYVITYCPTSMVGDWVDQASIIVLSVSSIFAFFVLIVLVTTARSVTKPLKHLRWGARRIGEGDFVSIEPEFFLTELEDMRCSMNEMSQKLQAAEQTQQRFFQNVSHELRSPLMSIGGYAQGIEQGVFDPPQHAAHTIIEESERMSRLVDSILCLSRLESLEDDRKSSELERIDAGRAMEQCIERMKCLANARGVEIRANLAKNAQAIAEDDLLDKAMGNMLSNAIRYANSLVEIACWVDFENDSVVATVHDDGPGIPETDVPHVFERCYKGEGGQFGLGLAIAKTATERMGATIEAANAPEGGALFTLRLRRAQKTSN